MDTLYQSVGRWRGVDLDVVAWDGVTAEVDLSIACMFESEMPGSMMKGGLLDLDHAIDRKLSQLRREGAFRAQIAETLFIATPPSTVKGGAVLVIGLGDPIKWTTDLMERAGRIGLREAVRRKVKSAAFAPSLLDAGLTHEATKDASAAILRGVVEALDVEHRLTELGLAQKPSLTRWVFDSGADHLVKAAGLFNAEFAVLSKSQDYSAD